MINYLRSVIGEMMEKQNPTINQAPEIDNDTILEYASLIQELDDLTEKGTLTKYATVRAPIDIPLDDDIELNSIEFNITDGRITDIPSDATVTEEALQEAAQAECDQIDQKYVTMKTRDDFIEEAYTHIRRHERESDARYNDRVYEYAMGNWKAYNEMLFQEGVYGHNKVTVNDLAVPDKIHLDFGATTNTDSANHHYAVTLPIRWQVDNKNRVTKKQIDSVQVWSKFGAYGLSKMTDEIYKHLGDKFDIPGAKKKWDVMTPTDVIVPIEPSDEYCIAVGFDTDYSKQVTYYRFSLPVKALKMKNSKDVSIPDNASGRIAPMQVENIKAIRKRDYKLEQETIRVRRRGRFDEDIYQEAIDFGGDATPEATADAGGGDMPPVENAAPTVDAGGGDTTIDAGADTANAAPPVDDQPAPDAQTANVNDVSDQIAQNVENVTAQENEENNETMPEDTGEEDIDLDNPDSNDVDAEIDSLDDMGNGDASVDDIPDDTGNTPDDLDDMTIDELVAQGAEKLKGMTINQLKSFISAPDGTSPEEVQSESFRDSRLAERVVTEGFFTNASNIKERIIAAIDDVGPGLVKIYKGCKSRKWDRFKLRKFWSAVRTYESDEPDDEDLFDDTGMGGVYKGNQFRSYVGELLHYLRLAGKKKSRPAFQDEHSELINRSRNALKQFHDICDKACSKMRIKHDFPMGEVADKARFALSQIIELKKAIAEDPMFADEFAESYIQEATFITKKNIRQEMEKHIKSSLAILNDTQLSYRQLSNKFREEEKALSKILNKASKMNGIFSTRELSDINELRADLSNVASNMRMNALNDTETARVKHSIIAYVDKCKDVSAYLSNPASVQEACPACDGATTDAPAAVKEETTPAPMTSTSGPDVPMSDTSSTPDPTQLADTSVDISTMDTTSTTPEPTTTNDTGDVDISKECGDNNNQEPVPVTESARNYTPIRWNDTKKLKDKGLISRFEQSTRFTFPKEFKTVITESNGGTPSKRMFRTNKGERAIKTFLSFNRSDTDNVWSEYDWHKEKLDDKYIPFAVDVRNNPICFDKRDKSVVVVTESAVESAGKSFSRFMTSLFIK